MTIARIETFLGHQVALVRVEADSGACGWGQIAPYNAGISVAVLHEMIAWNYLGRPVEDYAALAERAILGQYKFTGSFVCRAVAGIDTALWDLRARVAHVPVWKLANPDARPRSLPVYGSSMSRQIAPADEAARLKRWRDELGVTAFKCRVGGAVASDVDAWPHRSQQIARTLREALGDDAILLADANGCYAPEGAIETGKMLQDYGFAYFEEPCPFWEIEGTARVNVALDLTVCGGEQDFMMSSWRRLLETGAVDLVQPDVCYLGGFTRTLQVAQMARERGLGCMPHCANHSLLLPFTIHALAAIPNAGPFVEYSIETTDWDDDIYAPAFEVRDGRLSAPDAPGWGVEINGDWLQSAARRESRV